MKDVDARQAAVVQHLLVRATRVLEGVPDHRDVVLTDSERKASKTMMICCSGSKTERLVLDL